MRPLRLAGPAAVAAAGIGLSVLAASPALAADPNTPWHSAVPYVHLTTKISGPMFGDDAEAMYYSFDVTNAKDSETAATGIELQVTILDCPAADSMIAQCTQLQTEHQSIDSLAPGQAYNGPITINLNDDQTVRFYKITAEVQHVDQLIRGKAPGTCDFDLDPSPLCASTTDDLQP